MFAPGLCAMLIAAVAVSAGCEFPFIAFPNNMVHGVEDGPAEFTQAPRMSASVSIVACGTTPLPLGVVGSATPRPSDSRFCHGYKCVGHVRRRRQRGARTRHVRRIRRKAGDGIRRGDRRNLIDHNIGRGR